MLQSPEALFILDKLTNDLPTHLHYHSVHHTLDVYTTAALIGRQEGIFESDMRLLLVAALFHDSGFLVQSAGHEEISCRIASENLPQFGYSDSQIDIICKMIRATKIPQNPDSLLEKIICDADLDYLGREDFFTTAKGLYNELIHEGSISGENQWNQLQVDFLSQHKYFTETSKKMRNAQKESHLQILLSKLK